MYCPLTSLHLRTFHDLQQRVLHTLAGVALLLAFRRLELVDFVDEDDA